MRRFLLIAAVAALVAGCSKPCRDLGEVICECAPGGVSKETCKRQVSDSIDGANPTDAEEARCSDYLDSCHEPDGVEFCDWLKSEMGKEACGLAYR